MPASHQDPKQDTARLVHDLKTPLSAMKTVSDLIAQEPLSNQQQHYLETLQKALSSLNELTNQLLSSHSHTQTHHGTASRAETAPKSILEQLVYIVDLFSPEAQSSGHTLTKRWSRDAMSAYTTHSDELQRILAVLVDNAILYSNPGTIILSAHIKFSNHTPNIVVTLKDAGPGLKPEQASRMDAAPTLQRKADGHGIGLWSARHLACEIGGDLRLITNSKRETCFELILPLQEIQREKQPAAEATVATRSELSGSVLLVDDNTANREVLAAIFSSFGLLVRTANSGKQALELQQKTPADVIFLDLNMPEMDGSQTLRQMIASGLTKPKACFAITASVAQQERPRLFQEGFTQILEKPINPSALYSLLESTLHS
ncbi:Autoinducer 2 sensor kinase/phosphatase LuxQ [Pseudovibrio axinellae]|uniref:histidine kinase n=1 Tax=Pseudovibrio axinellae TaxID=989403 RepID=A0A161XIE2_9HYPH|nr:hybrid sensor histidine kinase/response regulator [Pseudovibrio axinellae]KZL21754.1 Autoinducer 2 sensor kinase/phosphatase LuxQ [Pseudovibrio axinellae]SEQ22065.1 His Kinase A (phospho-acceptor) domain-containing protein [Pseudovibrio axinellae]